MLLIPAYAKVNLCLAVRGRRNDGYHDIDSVVCAIDWHDIVGIGLRRTAATTVELRVSGDADGLPGGDGNIAARAANAIAADAGPFEVRLWLDKRVPREAGLGGGSADAAAVLRGCAALAGGDGRGYGPFEPDRLLRLAAAVGSDVPVLLSRGTQRMRGRGERVEQLPAPPLHMAVAVVGASSTAAVYGALRPEEMEDERRSVAVAASLAAGRRPADELLGSGLEAAACRSNRSLGDRLARLRAAAGGAPWHLTGSGGAAFALAGDTAGAQALAAAATAAGFPARACRSVSG